MIREIWTLRSLRHQVFRQVLEGWEDDFVAELGLALIDKGHWEERANGRIGTFLRKVDVGGRWFTDNWCLAQNKREARALMFAIFAPHYCNSYVVQSEVIPVIIDCWGTSLNKAVEALGNTAAVVVTNIELVPEFEKRRPGLQVIYSPLAVEAKVASLKFKKKYDLIQVGRKNPKLHEWAIRLTNEKPGIEYLYADTSGTWPKWFSTRRGELTVGLSRGDYLETLGSAKIALVSAPGIDGGEARTGGFNPVTPRFYEAAALGCKLIGRFPPNGADFVQNEVASVCANVDSYEEFVVAVSDALSVGQSESPLVNKFIEAHTGREMARTINQGLAGLGFKLGAHSK